MTQHTDQPIASYTLKIKTSTGYSSTSEGQCNPHQYSMAIAALNGLPHTSQKLLAQRDELLAALKMATAFEEGGKQKARAAIAKVEKS